MTVRARECPDGIAIRDGFSEIVVCHANVPQLLHELLEVLERRAVDAALSLNYTSPSGSEEKNA